MIKLTDREIEVIELLSKGLNNAEIGKALSVSEHTAKAHVASIFKKFNVKNRVQASVFYVLNKFENVQTDSKPAKSA